MILTVPDSGSCRRSQLGLVTRPGPGWPLCSAAQAEAHWDQAASARAAGRSDRWPGMPESHQDWQLARQTVSAWRGAAGVTE